MGVLLTVKRRPLNESELITGCLKGSKKAQDELYQRHAGRLFSVCLRYTRNSMEAEDVLQEAFVRIFKKMDTFRSTHEQALYPWMHRVTVNVSLNYLRDNKRYRFTEDIDKYEEAFEEDTHDNDPSAIFQMIKPAEVLQIISSLPAGYRTVFNLYAFEGYGHKEIADSLGISVNTSKTQLMKARRAIIEKLQNIVKSESKLKLVI